MGFVGRAWAVDGQVCQNAAQMDRIPRSGLDRELRLLIEHQHGIQGAEKLDLPLLRMHPAVLAEIPSEEEPRFEKGLRVALVKTLGKLERPEAAEVLSWEFGLAEGSAGRGSSARTSLGVQRVGIGKEAWRHDGYDAEKGELNRRGQRTRALERVVQLLSGASKRSDIQRPSSVEVEMSTSQTLPNHRLTRRSIRIGRLEIDHAISVASCDLGQSSARELLLEFEKDLRPSRADPDEWPLLEAQLLPVLQEEARKRIAKFEDGPALDFVHVEHQPSTPDGPHRYKIGVAETGYYLWATTSNSLDRKLADFPDLTKRLGRPTLREGWDCDPSTLADLARLPAPAYMGVCVVVIAEEQIVVLRRQRDHFVASTAERIPAHFVGEGMEPKDRDASGRFSPESAAWRGCSEELGVGPDDFHSFIPTGLIIDTKRWQPLFCFVAECELTISRLKDRMREAKDKYETAHGEIAACLPWTVQNEKTLALMAGDDPTFSLASNHAQAALLHALYYADGRQAVEDQLTHDTAT
jgi:hypothetical protein